MWENDSMGKHVYRVKKVKSRLGTSGNPFYWDSMEEKYLLDSYRKPLLFISKGFHPEMLGI